LNCFDAFNPEILLGDRLGLTLYMMFVEGVLTGSYRAEEKLYSRFIRNFPGEAKIHTVENFIKLIHDMKEHGFDPLCPVYANPDEYSLMEGAHRCAVAIQLGIRSVPYNLRFHDDRTDESVFKKILSPEELHRLYRKREEYLDRCDADIKFRCQVRALMRETPEAFYAPFSSKTKIPTMRPYQGSVRLGILGKRPAERRFEVYELQRHMRREASVLEIGCNVGFFTLVVAKNAAAVEAFDVETAYIKIARLAQTFSRINNCSFNVDSVKTFRPDRQYDAVISTATHGWSGLPFHDYVQLIDESTKPGGTILFESHEIDAEKDWPDKKGALSDKFELIDGGLIDDVDKAMYASEMREFLILKKRTR
jgi:2-polyprenyl-3-methyl-5-hydroxy-6-metoxy-1,4-benzoquinol methylase